MDSLLVQFLLTLQTRIKDALMIKTIIFDLDGLLIDSERIWYKVWNDFLGLYGHSFTLEEYVQKYSGKIVPDIVELLAEDYHFSVRREEGADIVNAIEETYVEKGVPLMDGAKELLDFLKENHYKMVIGTSSRKDRAIKVLQKVNVLDYFDDLVVGYDVKRAKPFPDTFLEAAKRVNAVPEECLVLEDSENGIMAAYEANIPVICIPDMKMPSKENADKTVAIYSSLREVIDYLKEH